jgi:iron complex outermembrane recepter protein
MVKRELNRAFLGALLAATALIAPDAAFAQARGSGVEEIVVTASKRSEKLQDVPSAITAISGDAIQKLGIDQLADYMNFVPGLSSLGNSAPGHGQIILRGLSTGAQQTTSTAAFYLDDTPFGTNGQLAVGALTAPDPDMADVERIEVLKGPQGTLYGASALGGVIKIVSKRPNLNNFEGSVRVSGSSVSDGGVGYGLRAVVNAPIVADKVAIRATAFTRSDAPFTDNTLLGEDKNRSRITGGRLSVRFQPTDKIDLQINGFFQELRAYGASAVELNPVTFQPIYGDLKYHDRFGPTYRTSYKILNATANVDLGFATLTNALSFSKQNDSSTADYTDAYGIALAAVLPANSFQVSGFFSPNFRRISDELRLASPNSKNFEWLAGLYVNREVSHYQADLRTFNAAGQPFPGAIGAAVNNFYTSATNSNFTEYAAFADVTYYLNEQLDVTGGVRVGRNHQYYSLPNSGLLAGGRDGFRRGSSSETSPTALATIRWRPVENLNLYARAASGYRPGGPTTTTAPGIKPTVDADTVWNYEVGAKTTFLDGKASFNVAAYYIDWSDIQLNTLVGGILALGNGGKAVSQGVEFDLTYAPVQGLTLSANGAFSDAHLEGDAPAVNAKSGDRLPNSPRWSFAGTADYQFPAFAQFNGLVGGSIRYQGTVVTAFSGDPLNTRVKLPDYTTLDLRAGLESAQYDVMLRLDNVADERAYSSGSIGRISPTQNIPLSAVVIRPRTISLTLTARF